MKGRPLRFLVLVVGSWTALRVFLLWSGHPGPAPARTIATIPRPKPGAPGGTAAVTNAPSQSSRAGVAIPAPTFAMVPMRARTTLRPGMVDPDLVLLALVSFPGYSQGGIAPPSPPAMPPPPGFPSGNAARSRWSADGWFIARGGRASAASPLLGGTQTGVRVAYALDEKGRTAAFGRIAAPLGRGSAELAAGLQWRPGGAPVTAAVEARLLRGRVAPAVGAFGGGRTAFAGFRLEGYAQAGMIGRAGVSGYGDGQLRLTRPFGPADIGIGAWAAAQRGAARLDVGPTLALGLPTRPLAVRVTLDWRQRIAGNARPASGPALSLGADF